MFIARAKNPEGPYEKWNGNGWGGDPYAITRYSGDGVGCSMPSFTVKGDTLYMYYVDQTHPDQDWNSEGNISVSTFSLKDPNWPGNELSNKMCENKPEEVRYCPDIDKFIGFQLKGGWDYDSYVEIYESTDGVNFTKTSSFRNNFPHYAHNIGISGNNLGQLDLSIQNYIGTAYTPTGVEAWWGHWHTQLIPLYIREERPSSTTSSQPSGSTDSSSRKPTTSSVGSTDGESSETEVSEPQNSNIESTVSDDKDKDKEVNNKTEQQEETSYLWLYIVIGAVVVLAGAGTAVYFLVIKKKHV